MSLHLLAAGALIGDPQRREGAKGRFTTATIRVATGEPAAVSIIAFGELADRLLEFVTGDAIAVSGRARLTNWTGRDGTERHRISVVVEQIAAAKPQRRRAAGPKARKPQDPIAALPDDFIGDLWPEQI